MDIFGLTPIDSALSAWGLICSQKLTEFFFSQSHLGITAFAIGFVWSVWESSREANFKYFAIFIVLSLVGIFLFILPQRQETNIKSAMEAHGGGNINPTAQSLKDSQTHDNSMPLVLSFIGQMADMVNMGAISILDNTLSNSAHFLSNPFGLQKLSFQAYQLTHSPIADASLKQDLDDFIYAHYLPSLNMYLNKAQAADLHTLWPGDARITRLYSSNQRSQWDDLKNGLSNLLQDPQSWGKIRSSLSQTNIFGNNLDNQIIASVVNAQLYHSKSHSWWNWASIVPTSFPYILGWGNFCLYVGFPPLMLSLIIVRRMTLFLKYVEIFIWVKSWTITAAISYYISLMAARIQAQTSTQYNWFWDYPYYALLASMLLCLMPILTLVGIHQGFSNDQQPFLKP